jgi:hypothetical protein
MRPFATATSRDKEHGKSTVERAFAILLVVSFVIVFDAVTWQRRSAEHPGHSFVSIMVVDSLALLFYLWCDGFFAFFDLW